MNATVTALPKPARRPKADKPAPSTPPVRSAAWKRKLTRQRYTSYGTAGVALVLMGLSLSHLAAGIGALTHSDPAHAWAMAVGIDLGFIALELGSSARRPNRSARRS
ncbi:hypothetical protein MWF94_25975 [Escherichia coli]|uniref:hypothetical protein n=1 Tax=Escherichia coli TaxID=562 RepID=UPI00201FF06A|nr:hypothetical protein [Escherichia coli]MCL7441040.1 hypothetical protein [Escherichia coli]